MQRIFDIVFSGVALLFFSPLMIPILIILRLTGEGEVFFLQDRVGRYGNKFKLIKFATMLKDSPNIGTGTVTVHKDPRILPLGGFFRKTKINELPQLINIFKGDMSIIGPRPQTNRCFNAFPCDFQKEIIKVRPGLSGVGSIIFRNEEEMMHANNDPDTFYNEIIMPYKGSLEAWYVQHRDIFKYFSFIFITLLVIILPLNKLIFKIYPSIPKVPNALIQPFKN